MASPAYAHAPMPRAVRVRDDFVALALPGFGMVVGAAGRFAYACDALLGLPPSDAPPALVLRADGVLLLGSLTGLRAMTKDGCPRAWPGALAELPVYALAAEGPTLFAFAGDGVWQSTDGGESWQLRSPFASGAEISSLLYAGGKLYATRGTNLLVSEDHGASFRVATGERALTLLAADSGLWALARAPGAVGTRGFEIVRGESSEGPWRTLLSLDYFGGLTIDAAGTVWVGDEGGGLHRLDGEAFTNVAPELYPACLQADGARVFSCNEDLPSQPALYLGSAPVLRLEEVDRLVACEGVATECAAAWVEWQRDVLLLAGLADAAVPAGPDAAIEPPVPKSEGCALGTTTGASWALLLALSARASRRRKLRGA